MSCVTVAVSASDAAHTTLAALAVVAVGYVLTYVLFDRLLRRTRAR